MTKFSFSIDHFAQAAKEGNLPALQRLGRLGELHESLAGEILNHLAEIRYAAHVIEISKIGSAHESQSVPAIKILAGLKSSHAYQQIGVIALDQPSSLSYALEILGSNDHCSAAQSIRLIAFALPEYTEEAFEKLKRMKNISASFEISMLSRRNTKYAVQGIEALEFRGDELGIRHIIEIGENFSEVARFAVAKARALRQSFECVSRDSDVTDFRLDRLANRMQLTHS